MVSKEGFYEIGHLLFSPNHPIMPFAQYIRLKREKELQGTVVVLSVGEQTGIQRPVDILPEKNLQPF